MLSKSVLGLFFFRFFFYFELALTIIFHETETKGNDGLVIVVVSKIQGYTALGSFTGIHSGRNKPFCFCLFVSYTRTGAPVGWLEKASDT